ncbi:MAG TPA: hypothetical protein VFT98_07935 [Myxococcota bacterium]|nr:hypothetical protein [Myxococcota bacterium]
MTRAPRRILGALAVAGALAQSAHAEEAAKPAAPPTPACRSAEHRAFDFWLGAWRVETPAGKHAGHNTISAILGGCALLEQWEGASGLRGTSLNAWDAGTRRWRQTWIDGAGGVLLLEGGLEAGAMVMRGATREDAREVMERITWTPLARGAVKQHWQQSRDGGATWTDAFVGIYQKR